MATCTRNSVSARVPAHAIGRPHGTGRRWCASASSICLNEQHTAVHTTAPAVFPADRRGLALTALGIGLGLAGAYAAVGVLQSYMFDLNARDPLTFVIGIITLALASMLACCIPALRAASVDPLIALKAE